jgi:hypothetical protein
LKTERITFALLLFSNIYAFAQPKQIPYTFKGTIGNHVSDLQAWENAVVKEYHVMAVPSNFLIDPTGKIVGKDLRGDALSQTIEKLLDK